MGERHLERLFSEAYDGALMGSDRQRFEGHLAVCEQCTRAFDEYRAALDAVHDLPTARMPVPVRLPSSPPAIEPGAAGRWRSLLLGVLSPRPLGAATALAAAGVLVVVAATHVHLGGGGGGGGGSALSLGAASSSRSAGAGPPEFAAPGPLSVRAPTASLCSPGAPFSVAASPDASPPAGFDRSASTSVAGGTLVVAVHNTTVHPGDSVLVYARLKPASTAGGASSPAIVPCVALVAPSESAPQNQSGQAAAPRPAAPPPLAHATPALTQDASGAPLLTLTIPPDTPPGTTLRIVALVPAGTSGAGNASGTAELTISVT